MNTVPIHYLLVTLSLSLGLLMPLHVLPWVSWSNEWPVFASIGGVAVALLFRRTAVALSVVELFAACIGLIVVVQGVTGVIPFAGDAIVVGLYVWSFAIAVLAGRTVRDLRSAMVVLAITVCVVATISVFIALLQAFGVWTEWEWVNRMPLHRRPGANIGQPNLLTTLIVWGLLGLDYLYRIDQRSKEPRNMLVGSAAILFLLLFGAALTESRTGLITISTLYFVWIGMNWSYWSPLQRMLAGGPLVFYWLSVWLVPKLLHIFWQEGGGAASASFNLKAGTRLTVWPQLWDAVLLKPWAGWGLTNVSEAHNAVLDRYTQSEPFSYAHNIVLDLAIGMGLPLTACVVVVVAVWLFARVRVATALHARFCLAMLFALVVHSMLEFPFSYAFFLFPAGFLVGVMERESPNKYSLDIPRVLLVALNLVALFLLVGVAWEYHEAEEDFRVARFQALRVGQTPDDYAAPKLHLLSQLDAMLVATRTTPRPGMPKSEIELLRKAAMRFPWTAIQGRYALTLALNGNVPEARRQLLVIRALYGEEMLRTFQAQWREKSLRQYPQLGGVADF